MPRRSAAAALVSILALLAGAAGLALTPDDAAPEAGQVPVVASAPGESAPVTAPPPPGPSSPVGVRSSRLEDLTTARRSPVGVTIEAAGIDAAVVPVGVDPGSGALSVPDDVAVAGWYRFGPAPGEPGSAVLTAHVDSARQGAGAFFPLRDVAPGSAVTVTFDDGSTRSFAVVARRTHDKDALPVEELFAREGAPVLTLVTCGGAFDAATRSYEENVVVYAVPAT